MSHGDQVARPAAGLRAAPRRPNAGRSSPARTAQRRLFGIQFHPEVSHTVAGAEILRNFLYGACGARGDWTHGLLPRRGDRRGARAGGGAAACSARSRAASTPRWSRRCCSRAIGERSTAVFVDTRPAAQGRAPAGRARSLRDGLGDSDPWWSTPRAALPRRARRRRGSGAQAQDHRPPLHRRLRRGGAQARGRCAFLAQGTLYPDVIESTSVKGPSAVIKTHHNVGGLPERLGFELVEPLRFLFKDEVRQLGRELGLPESLIGRHPFPGPGPRGAHPRRGHRRAGARCCRKPTRSSSTSCARAAGTTRRARPSPCCCRSRASA